LRGDKGSNAASMAVGKCRETLVAGGFVGNGVSCTVAEPPEEDASTGDGVITCTVEELLADGAFPGKVACAVDELSAVVLPLPLLFRFIYCAIASASRSRTRVAIGDNTDAAFDAPEGGVTTLGCACVGVWDNAFVGVCSDLCVPDPLIIDDRSPKDAFRVWVGMEFDDDEFEGMDEFEDKDD